MREYRQYHDNDAVTCHNRIIYRTERATYTKNAGNAGKQPKGVAWQGVMEKNEPFCWI